VAESVVHADWGRDPRKRWVARARRGRRGWAIEAIERWSGGPSPLESIGLAGQDSSSLIGVDFPIGVPRVYAEVAGITSFARALPEFGRGRWTDFYDVAETADQISIGRPFYPRASGVAGTVKRVHLEEAHGAGYADLLRLCERPTAGRRAACCLFWTLGGNQVGKAAIAGWRELVVPLVRDHEAAVWPFDGTLAELVSRGRPVVAETYPTQYYAPLGFPTSGWSKRNPEHRRARADAILAAAHELEADVAPAVRASVTDGFGPSSAGEDPFDALVGLVGMLRALRDGAEAPRSDAVQNVEGWLRGQPVPAM
jgi:hypothetical protein